MVRREEVSRFRLYFSSDVNSRIVVEEENGGSWCEEKKWIGCGRI